MIITSVWFPGAPASPRRTANRLRPPAGHGLYHRRPWRACSPASSPPARSTSATTWARSGAGSTSSTTTTPSTASSTSTPSPSPRTRPSCGPRSSSSPSSCVAAGLDPEVVHAVRAEPRRRARRAGLAHGVHGGVRRAAAHDPVQGQVRPGRLRVGRRCSPTRRCRRPTSCCTTPTRCRSATTSASTSSWPATWPCGSTRRYGDTFVVPAHAIPPVGGPGDGPAGARAQDVQVGRLAAGHGAACSTSPRSIERKFKRAVTDSDAEVRYDPEAKPGVSNLLSILGCGHRQRARRRWPSGYEQYGPLKADAAEAVIELLRPLQAALRRAGRRPGRDRPHPAPSGADKARKTAGATAGPGPRPAGPRARLSGARAVSAASVVGALVGHELAVVARLGLEAAAHDRLAGHGSRPRCARRTGPA